ncbi:MAG: TetR/AcrR family transcriptional regulator [bacterium]
MGYKYSRDDILAAAVDASIAEGVGSLTFGRLAKRLGINDRTIVYYFPNKDALILAVTEVHSARLQALLASAFDHPASGHRELAQRAWPILATNEAAPVFRVFFELIGLGLRGESPYDVIVPAAFEAWLDWIMPLVNVPDDRRRAEGEAALALLDGLLLLRQIRGPEAPSARARQLGVSIGPTNPM